VHGGGATDLRTWRPQIEPLGAHYRVIAYSQRYHFPNPWAGDGSGINDTSVDAADLAALIGALELGRVHLIGNSYGADVVLRFAVERPDLVRTLVLEEPGLLDWLLTLPGGPALLAEYAGSMAPAKRAAKEGDLGRATRLFIDAALGSGIYDQLPDSTVSRLMENARLIGYEPTEPGDWSPDIARDDAAQIQAPTLLLTGENSPKMFRLVSQELARCLPNAERAWIAEAAHVLHYMNPQAFNDAVLAFLAKHSG
jgi:pimeloyl-ACP methyl ester carboxylesterase